MALASWGQADRRATVGLCCLVGPGVRGIGNRCGLVAWSATARLRPGNREPGGPKPMVWNGPDSEVQTIWVVLEEPNTSTAATTR